MDRLDAPFSVDATTHSSLHQEMYDLHNEGLVRGRLGIHQLLPECDHRLTLVYHLISSRHHPLLNQEVYGLEGGPHTRISPPLHQQPISSITRSGGVRTRGWEPHTRGTRHTSILRDAPSTDISLPLVQETPITPMEVPSTPPVVPLVASSPPSIEVTLVHEELVHIANDDQ